MVKIGVAVAAVIYLIIFVGQLYDLTNGTGSVSGVYIEKNSAREVSVSGFRTGVKELGGLQKGDVIVGIGTGNEQTTGSVPEDYFTFRHALDVADGQMLIRRNGEVLQLQYDLQRYQWPAAVMLRLVVLGVLAIVMLRYSVGSLSQTAAAGFFLLNAWGQGAPIGPSGEATAVLTAAWCVGQAMCCPILVNLAQRIAHSEVTRNQLAWPWVLSPIGAVLYMNYTGQGLPHELPWLLYVGLLFATAVATVWVFHRGYRDANSMQRRQIQWVISSVFIITILFVIALILDSVSGEANALAVLFVGGFCTVVIPIAFVLAIFKTDIIPIDRAIVTTATYAILAVVLALAIEFLVEPLAGLFSSYLGMSESAGQTTLIVGIALGASSAKRRLQPYVQRMLRRYEEERP